MTNQEKMTKIYELTGIEPRMCSGKSSGGDLVISDYYNVYDEYRIDLPNPYYPAEQLWELLPKRIDASYFLLISDIYLHYKYFGIKINEPDLISIDVAKESLLTALLDMVLWCISEGYIKKRGEE